MTSTENSNRFLLTLFGMQKAKSKVNIIITVLMHAAGWCLLLFLPLLLYPVRINDNRFIIPELVDKSILIILFYLNYYLLIPRLFEKKKYLSYFSLTLLVFILYLFQHAMMRVSYFSPPGPFRSIQISGSPAERADSLMPFIAFVNNDQVMARRLSPDSMLVASGFRKSITSNDSLRRIIRGFPPGDTRLFGIPRRIWLMTLNNAVSSFALLFLIGGFIRLAFSFIRNQNEKKILENANLNAEVNFLKSQINPHFLFNTLNSIYAQAHSRSDKTEFSILKLSEMLRYVLYDSGENNVDLAKDIRYIDNYIDLQKIRLSSKVKINYSVEGDLNNSTIAPMLLITFIENAFKHGISYMHPSTVTIQIEVFEKTLTLLITNPVVNKNSFTPGGLGLKNVTRRLDLLYPKKYLLDIHSDDLVYIVNLKLDLTSD